MNRTGRGKPHTVGIAAAAASRLIEDLCALDEPWRGRFLILTAQLATGWRWDGREPRPDELAVWLGDSLNLQHDVRLLLHVWTGGKECLHANDGSSS